MLIAGNMKRLFGNNNIFTNPQGWAGKAVGALWRYRFMQAMTILGGIVLFLIFVLGSDQRGWPKYVGPTLFISIFAVVFPLMELRALRHLYMKTQQSQSNQQ